MGGVGHHPDDVPCVPITRLRLGQKKCLKTVLQIWRVVGVTVGKEEKWLLDCLIHAQRVATVLLP